MKQKSTKTQPKINRKSIKNQPKIIRKSLLERSRRSLRAKTQKNPKKSEILASLGTVLDPSWRPLDAVLALGSPSWAVLGRLGALLSPLKSDVKIDQKKDAFQDRFLHQCWWILGRKMEPSWHQHRSKIVANCEKWFLKNRALAAAEARFLRFWGSKIRMKNYQRSL